MKDHQISKSAKNRRLPSKLTFEKNRKCLHCGEPIADHEHATREFCEKFYDECGKVHDCKTDYHRINDKPERLNHSNLINHHKSITNRISGMVLKKGYTVSTDDLDAYDISLADSLRFEMECDGTLISYFLEHLIISNPITNQHIIKEHEQSSVNGNSIPSK